MTDKKEEKKPLDMTSDEAIDYLFGLETANKLREIAHEKDAPPSSDKNVAKAKGKSAQRHSTS